MQTAMIISSPIQGHYGSHQAEDNQFKISHGLAKSFGAEPVYSYVGSNVSSHQK